jgi:hypothetical protein
MVEEIKSYRECNEKWINNSRREEKNDCYSAATKCE